VLVRLVPTFGHFRNALVTGHYSRYLDRLAPTVTLVSIDNRRKSPLLHQTKLDLHAVMHVKLAWKKTVTLETFCVCIDSIGQIIGPSSQTPVMSFAAECAFARQALRQAGCTGPGAMRDQSGNTDRVANAAAIYKELTKELARGNGDCCSTSRAPFASSRAPFAQSEAMRDQSDNTDSATTWYSSTAPTGKFGKSEPGQSRARGSASQRCCIGSWRDV
jgi:hypothetical protein